MALSHHQTLQYLSGNFIISAGSILFRKRPSAEPDSSALEICILHHLTEDEWLLPKGRKDRGETIEQAAIRETYEETGYPCHLWPQRMPTRAPAPGINDTHYAEVVDNITEPVAVAIRDLGEGRAKLIFWYIALAEDGAEKVAGSQMENENFESAFLDIPTVLERLTFQNDREVVQQAVDIVKGGAKGMTLRDPSAALKEKSKS
jgi:8-oxo-dGTP pyrophosphatase MutT (NUDIX family)